MVSAYCARLADAPATQSHFNVSAIGLVDCFDVVATPSAVLDLTRIPSFSLSTRACCFKIELIPDESSGLGFEFARHYRA